MSFVNKSNFSNMAEPKDDPDKAHFVHKVGDVFFCHICTDFGSVVEVGYFRQLVEVESTAQQHRNLV